MSPMWWDISLQLLVALFSIATYLYTNNIPQKLIQKYKQYKDKNKHKARTHFVRAAEHLARSRLNDAVAEADAAIAMDPTDAANHILKAIALERQGFKTSALEAMDAALAPVAAKSMEVEERADAMVKRAGLRVEVSRIGRGGTVEREVYAAAERELREALEMRKESGRGWWLLGECCQGLGKTEEAKAAFEEARRVAPELRAENEGGESRKGEMDN